MSRSEFYRSRSWREFVELLKIERTDENGFIICAHCGKPIVKKYDCIGHHKEELTEENYENPEISLNPDNVVLVHQRCHNLIHDKLGYVEKKVYIVYGSPLSGKSSYVKSLQNEGGVTQEMVDQAQYMVEQAQLELDKYADGASEAGGVGATAFANGMLMKNDLVSDAAAGTADTAKSQLDGADTYSSGTSIVDKLASGIQDNSAVANTAGQTVAGNAIDGISSRNGDAEKAGEDFSNGFANGIVGGITAAGDAAVKLAQETMKKFKSKEGLDEHSPSKKSYDDGDLFVAGFRNAIVDKTKNAVKAIKNLAADSLKALNSELSNDINVPEISATANTLKKAGSCTGATTETGTEQRTIIQNFYQTNNSPKSLSRLEIYRNTKNLLGFAGGPQ